MNGYSDFENKIKMNGKEKYNVYSCSKIITCTAALMLIEQGLFDLEDKLSDYMPEFKEMMVKTENGIKKAENPILIKNLFDMTAGFSYDTETETLMKCKSDTNGKCPTREVMKYLAKEPLCFEPGSRWQYSLCHDILAALIEVVAGMKFEDYTKKYIFDVIGMNDTTFLLSDDEIESVACQYRFEDGKLVNIGKEIPIFKFGTEYASGGAGAISTVDDFMKFLEALRKGELLKSETLQLMITDQLPDSIKHTYWTPETQDYGYGLGVRCPIGDEIRIDFGWGGAASAYFAIDLENEITLYFAGHLLSSPAQSLRSKLYRFIRAEILNEEEFKYIENDLKEIKDYNLTY